MNRLASCSRQLLYPVDRCLGRCFAYAAILAVSSTGFCCQEAVAADLAKAGPAATQRQIPTLSTGWVNKVAPKQRCVLELKQHANAIVENPFRVSEQRESQPRPAVSTILVSDNSHADLGFDLQILGETKRCAQPVANPPMQSFDASRTMPNLPSTLVISQPTTEVLNPFLVESQAAARINTKASVTEPAKAPANKAICSEPQELAVFVQEAEKIPSFPCPVQPEDPTSSSLPTAKSIDISALAESMHETSSSFVDTIEPASSRETVPSIDKTASTEASSEPTLQFGEAELSFAPSTLIEPQESVTQAAPICESTIYESTGVSNCSRLFSSSLDMTIMHELNVDLRARRGEKDKLPEDLALNERGSLQAAPQIGTGCRRYTSGNVVLWAAPKFHHQPLYFEQPMLERYGHHVHGNCVQSVISAAHFFGSIPLLPYKLGANPPLSCDYTLGHWRPGNCNPRTRFIPEVSTRGLVSQSLFVTGTAFFVP